MNNRLLLFLFTAALFLVTFSSCKENKESKTVFREIPMKRDKTCAWLADKSNFYKENYDSVFTAYYSEKIAQKNYLLAANAMQAVCEKQQYFFFFKDKFLAVVIDFQNKYSRNLPYPQTLFLDSYLGNYHSDKGNFRKAIPYLLKITRHKAIDYSSCTDIAYAYYDLGFCYSAIGEQDLALKYNLKSLEFFEMTGNPIGIGTAYSNIALVHLFTKNYGESEEYFDKAISAYRAGKDSSNMLTTLHNKILLYEEINSPRKFELIDSAYNFFNSLDNPDDESLKISIYTYYVTKMLHDGNLNEAKKILDEVKQGVEKIASPFSTAEYNVALAEYQMKTKTGIIDTKLMENALAAVEEHKNYQNQISFAQVLKNDARLKKDYKRALLYAEKEAVAENNLAKQTMIVKTLELNKKHETEKKEQQIVLQKKTILNKNTTIALLFVAIAAFGLSVAFYQSRQKQKKTRTENQRALLYTRQLLEKTEEERKRIAGDLHDSVSHELLNLKNSMNDAESEAGTKIDTIINDIRIISRNLHPIMFEKVGLAASIEQLVDRAQSIYELMVTADLHYDSSLSVADELQVYRIVQEALSNTIKYAGAVAAKITLKTQQNEHHIEIKDNGKGFNTEEKLNSGGAFGLLNIFERTKAIGGEAKILSDKSGTIITITIRK